MAKRKRSEYYVNPKELFAEIQKFKDNPNEPMSDELGQMLINIANRFASKPNFNRYSYKDEFISEAIFRMVQQIHKIDLEHPKCNPFSYLTQCCYHIFIAKITKENKYVKLKDELADKFFEQFECDEQLNIKKSTTNDKELKFDK